jgi:hypothetical protein
MKCRIVIATTDDHIRIINEHTCASMRPNSAVKHLALVDPSRNGYHYELEWIESSRHWSAHYHNRHQHIEKSALIQTGVIFGPCAVEIVPASKIRRERGAASPSYTDDDAQSPDTRRPDRCSGCSPIGRSTDRLRVPVVVLEVVLGIITGPRVLGLLQPNPFLSVMYVIGMAATLFMAGMEIDFEQVRGRPVSLALRGGVASVGLALLVLALLRLTPGVHAPMMVAIALSTTGLGALLPILRDGGQLDTPFGRLLLAVGMIGEVGPFLPFRCSYPIATAPCGSSCFCLRCSRLSAWLWPSAWAHDRLKC